MTLNDRKALILDLGVAESAFPKLDIYLQLLWRSNEDLNLISRQMPFSDLIENHLIDCLLPLKHFPLSLKVVADLGSGGGMPGVVYAIVFPEIQFHLYEKSPKKRAFLEQCKGIAPNLRIFGEIPPQLDGVELVMARAFKPIDVILEITRNYYLQSGRYFLLKGRKEKIEEELVLARKKFKNLQVLIEPLHSPVLDVERHLVLI